MSLTLCGKCPPNSAELSTIADYGFENVELYLTTDHLDDFEETVNTCQAADVNIAVVHTPHVMVDETEYLVGTNDLARRLDADAIVAHSGVIEPKNADQVDAAVDWCRPTGYESNPGHSWEYIKNAFLDRGFDFTFDLAHVYIGEQEDFDEVFDRLVNSYGSERVPIVHVCDTTLLEDGLAFGEGVLDLPQYIQDLKENYEGIVTLEVLPRDQDEALSRWQEV